MELDLVFEGGGAKGMALVGAWETLQGQGHSFGRLLGTSAGAIMATFLTAGFSVDELYEALSERDEDGNPVFMSFLGPPDPFTEEELETGDMATLLSGVNMPYVPDWLEEKAESKLIQMLAGNPSTQNLLALVERGGWYTADRFVTWMAEKLDSGECNGEPRAFSKMTFAEVHENTGVHLSLVASDISGGQMLVLNHLTAPDCPLVMGVRMSMSIPLLWEEVIWQKEWGKYRGREIAGHAVVDGGMLSNFPIELFLSDMNNVTDAMGAQTESPILGLLIDERLRVPVPRGGLSDIWQGDARALGTVQRLMRLVNTATTAHDKMVMSAYSGLVVRLPAYGYGTTEFDMDDAKRDRLISAARNATAQHLAKYPLGVTTRGGPGPVAAAKSAANEIAPSLFD